MAARRTTVAVLLLIVCGAGGAAWVAFKDRLPEWLGGPAPVAAAEDEHDHAHEAAPDRVVVSEQAQVNLRLTSKPLETANYWKTLSIPGTIIERTGQTDQGVSAPSPGVVTKVFVISGDVIQPGQIICTLRLLGEGVSAAQNELFKANNELAMARTHRDRIAPLAEDGVVARSKLNEADNQVKRLANAVDAYRQDLQSRGLSPNQIEGVVAGNFVKDIEVLAPTTKSPEPGKSGIQPALLQVAAGDDPSFEIQELHAELGQQVQAGQPLCLLGRHATLDIEGRAFREETSLIEAAAKLGTAVEIDFLDDNATQWPPLDQKFAIRSVASTLDPSQRTLNFYLSINNPSRTYEKDGKQRVAWRFRPGQRVRLRVRTEQLQDVFVLPPDAVAHDGPETYVFRQNGNAFERIPVVVAHEDRQVAVLSPSEKLVAGDYIAQTAATQLNRALKSQSGSAHAGVHLHADGSIHQAGK